MKITLYTFLALLAFAGNSILCRLALGGGLIDAAGFTTVRLFSGAITLAVLWVISSRQQYALKPLFKFEYRQSIGAVLLFTYAICFSYAYVILDTGSGALVLFGTVQLTLLLAGFIRGKKPAWLEWFGVLLSFFGLVYLLYPAWGTPSLLGFALMTVSGMAWGFYTLAGKGSKSPLLETSRNFIGCIPLIIVFGLFTFKPTLWTSSGLILAVISGAVTSGVGYAIWYAVLPKLSTPQAGVLQLLVPILAALGGVVFAGEILTNRLIWSAVWVLGGVYLVILSGRLGRIK